MPFPEPLITHEGIVAALDGLVRELCAALSGKGRGARRLQLALYRADGSSVLVEAGLSAPTRAPAHLLRLLQDKIGAVDAGGFGVDLLVLGAAVTEALSFAQESFAKKDGLERQEPLVDRLANRLRPEAVLRLFPKESHLPERAQGTLYAVASSQPWPQQALPLPPRPPLLLAVPEPLEVIAEIPEGPPIRFTWRRVGRRVVKAEGPERIAPEWWLPLMNSAVANGIPPLDGEGGETERSLASPGEGDPGNPHPDPPPSRGREKRTRDYYRIEDKEGHRYWVFRDGLYDDGSDRAPAWYLHGVFG
jgi:protein ImuB